MNSEERQQLLRQRLNQALAPTFLEIENQSHLHIGHAGAKSGGSHFKVTVACTKFIGKNQLACHRMIYAAAGDLMESEIHALQIVCIA